MDPPNVETSDKSEVDELEHNNNDQAELLKLKKSSDTQTEVDPSSDVFPVPKTLTKTKTSLCESAPEDINKSNKDIQSPLKAEFKKDVNNLCQNVKGEKDHINETGMVYLDLEQLNPHLICQICSGYYRDAHTIMECLHTFCKSCLLKEFYQGLRSCPNCKIELGPNPLHVMLYDRTMQELVNKILPELEIQDKVYIPIYEKKKHKYTHKNHTVLPPFHMSISNLNYVFFFLY